MTQEQNDRDEHNMIRVAVAEMRKREVLDATKQAVKEMLAEQVAIFGWWSLKTLALAIVGAALVFILWTGGWHK